MPILLVDDHRLVLTTLAVSLVRLGYQVTRAESAEEAKESFASGRRPDRVILNVRVPGQGGLYFARHLREVDQIPFVMLSACNEAAICKYRHPTRYFGFLVKTMGEAQLLTAIDSASARAGELNDLRANTQTIAGRAGW